MSRRTTVPFALGMAVGAVAALVGCVGAIAALLHDLGGR